LLDNKIPHPSREKAHPEIEQELGIKRLKKEQSQAMSKDRRSVEPF